MIYILSYYWCKAWRKALKLRIDDLVEITGISDDTISRFENGKPVSKYTRKTLSETMLTLRDEYLKTHSVEEIVSLFDHPAFDRATNMEIHASRIKHTL